MYIRVFQFASHGPTEKILSDSVRFPNFKLTCDPFNGIAQLSSFNHPEKNKYMIDRIRLEYGLR